MSRAKGWSAFLSICGGLGVLLGSFDPMEGSALILPGSGLLALASYLGHEDHRTTTYRTWSFLLVSIGIAALFGLTAIGGVGGTSGRSAWWALLITPYVIGWSIDIWGPGSLRWLSVAGIGIGLWYLSIPWLMLRHQADRAHPVSMIPSIMVALVGLATIVACVARLRRI